MTGNSFIRYALSQTIRKTKHIEVLIYAFVKSMLTIIPPLRFNCNARNDKNVTLQVNLST